MELVDRYLQAVKAALPKGNQDDIVQELKDSILSQVEEKEAALGRPLNEDEAGRDPEEDGQPGQAGEPLPRAAGSDRADCDAHLLEGD